MREPSLQDIFDAIQDGISVLDPDLNIVQVNRWMEKMYSSKVPLVGRKCYEVYQKRDSPCPFCPSLTTVETGELRTTIVPYPSEKEPTGWIELSAFPLKDANGNVAGVIEYVKDVTERKRAEAALEHLNLTLKAIRNVNQLITHEQDRDSLLSRACELLTSYKGYKHAWIALLDESGELLTAAESGLGEAFQTIREMLGRGELPRCAQTAVKEHSVAFFKDVRSECVGCPLAPHYIEHGSLAAPLQHGGKAYGVLNVCIPTAHASDEDERSLLEEVAGDLAHALHDIDREEERKRAEEALRAERDRLRSLIAGLSKAEVGVDVVGSDYRVVFQNELMMERFGDLVGRLCYEGYMGLSAPCEHCAMRKAIEGNRTESVELTAPDGRCYHITAAPLPNPDGTVDKAIEVISDVTERKRAAEALRASKERLQLALEGADISTWHWDLRTGQLSPEMAWPATLGYLSGEIRRDIRFWEALVHPEDRAHRAEALRAHLDGKTPFYESIYRVRAKSGEYRWIASRGRVMSRDENGAPIRMAGSNLDITERKRAAEALRESKELYRTVFENTGTATILVEGDDTIAMANSKFEEYCGHARGDIEGKMRWTDFVAAEDLERMKTFHAARLSGEGEAPSEYEFRFVDRDGNVREMFLKVAVIPGTKKTVASLLDITERKQVEKRLFEAQKMEAIGRLAGGIAHDFNNILTAIIGHLDLMSMEIPEEDPRFADIEEIGAAASKASDLTRQLLAFSRKQIIAPRPMDLNRLVMEMKGMLRRLIQEDIEIQVFLGQDIPSIKADESQVEQVILNLALNARDAMPHGGRLTIETAETYLDKDYCSKHPYVQPGQYVMLAVTDTGMGMDEETLSHVFEPFFTTKQLGRGTGLGLSTVYGIMKQTGGSISVYSVEGEGTCFKAYFPAVGERAVQQRRVEPPFGALEGKGETIVVVEDERAVRELVERVLTRAGYKVKSCSEAGEAIALCQESEEPIDLLLSDVVMPGMPGSDLAEVVSGLGETKILFMSGYTENVITHRNILNEGVNFINKPFSSRELLRRVREVLES